MTYEFFYEALKAHQTHHIHALSLPESCSTAQIPEAFASLFDPIVNLLEQHRSKWCQDDQIIGVFALQPTSCAINSGTPAQLDRIIDPQHPTRHFCCSLSWLNVQSNLPEPITDWRNAKRIIVDFTTGILMNEEHCLYHVLDERHPGTIYGRLPASMLEDVWKLFKQKQYH